MFFYVSLLMWYFDNYTIGANLAMDGSYSYFWPLKDMVLPRSRFLQKSDHLNFPDAITIDSNMMPAYRMISTRTKVSNEQIFGA